MRTKAIWAIALAIAALTPLAHGVIIDWSDVTAGRGGALGASWAEGGWRATTNWVGGNVPNTSSETARFNRQNTAPTCTADGSEQWLEVELRTLTIEGLVLETESGGTGKLTIVFTGNNTLTCTTTVLLDATNGPVTFMVIDSATVKTN